MATIEYKNIFKKSVGLIEDYGVRKFLAESTNRGDTGIGDLIDTCGRINLIDLIENISEFEQNLSDKDLDSGYWLNPIREELNLHITYEDLKRAQLDAEILARNSMENDADMRQFITARLFNLRKIYEEHYRQVSGGLSRWLFSPKVAWEKQKNFVYLARLDGILDLIGIRSSTARRMYVKGVFEYKPKYDDSNTVSLKMLSSPMCVFDYIGFLKNSWYKTHAYDVKQAKKARNLKFGHDYYEEKINDTLCLTHSLIKNRKNGDSRLSLEIPEAFGNYDMMVWYGWGSENIRQLVRLGVIRQGWPVLYKLLNLLTKESKCSTEVLTALRKSKRYVDRMWRSSGIPKRNRDHDVQSVLPVLSMMSRDKEEVERWLYR